MQKLVRKTSSEKRWNWHKTVLSLSKTRKCLLTQTSQNRTANYKFEAECISTRELQKITRMRHILFLLIGNTLLKEQIGASGLLAIWK